MISIIDPGSYSPGPEWVGQVGQIFAPDGLLSHSKNFEYRPQQQRMAESVARTLADGSHLLVEAGTGVGKSLAYLIPAVFHAVLNRKKALISTHTINLQEQLTEKDLPILAKILPIRFKYTMLKGRSNYACTRRLQKAIGNSDSLFTSAEQQELQRIFEWAKSTQDGSLSDFEIEPEPKVWAQVCSERGLCSPRLCGLQSEFAKDHGPCFFQSARARTLAADVVVLNHTLFFTLLSANDEDTESGGMLYTNDFAVFDEAHTVEQVASRHIGLSVASTQLRFTLNRLWNVKTQKGILAALRLGNAVSAVETALDAADHFFGQVEEACNELRQRASSHFGAGTRTGAEGGEPSRPIPAGMAWSELRVRRPDLVADTISLPIQRLREMIGSIVKAIEDRDTGQELIECNRRLGEMREAAAAFLTQPGEDFVYWVQRAGKAQSILTLNSAPIDVAAYLRQRLFQSGSSVIMTSATLSVARALGTSSEVEEAGPGESMGSLEYFSKRIGGSGAAQLRVGSPFDYERQMKLYVVGKMPDPRQAGYRDALVHWVSHFVRQTHGKAFVLFTSVRLMHEVAAALEPLLAELGIAGFVQAKGVPRSTMLERFKEDIDSVLFGTDSFWQGVDVPGEALSNVIITRLPFSVPDHPLIEARVENIEARGGNAFAEFSLPEAILKFRQGVGRLIRSTKDRGIVVVLDNRVLTKRYGKAFLDAIPHCHVEIL